MAVFFYLLFYNCLAGGLSTKFNFETDLHKLVPNFLKVKRETAEGKKIIDEIRNFYFPNGFDKNNLTNVSFCFFFFEVVARRQNKNLTLKEFLDIENIFEQFKVLFYALF